jgi:hypothetical protein
LFARNFVAITVQKPDSALLKIKPCFLARGHLGTMLFVAAAGDMQILTGKSTGRGSG